MEIIIRNNSEFKKIYKNEIKKAVEYVLIQEARSKNKIYKNFLKKVGIDNIAINLILTNDKEIKKYNKKYLGRNTPTDVIAFSMIEDSFISPNNVVGDIIISLETVKKNGEIYKTGFKKELLLVVIHGVLHLLGYEHPEGHYKLKDMQSQMREKEKKYLQNVLQR